MEIVKNIYQSSKFHPPGAGSISDTLHTNATDDGITRFTALIILTQSLILFDASPP